VAKFFAAWAADQLDQFQHLETPSALGGWCGDLFLFFPHKVYSANFIRAKKFLHHGSASGERFNRGKSSF
jgi:hypothetical protein